ncbi:GBF-interacting protein 1-like isoform X2 [Macadamia integrifolia]|uniref:GBF-interacting protein 1-like isoform X2 n=1 Tax=Macadamia integrifolia TaxID=60698 RepID=UPI001C4FAB23|nr:GBF-interacting protein 1-like isoform X2 [Macadamia integrifolia]
MSSGGVSSNGKGNNGAPSIPATSRKMVQSLKEIVNYPEHEIYAMLKECNMDPNEAVQRLLTQDTFHEVKSKREKKKENKDTTESRSRGVSSALNRGSRSVADRNVGRGGSSQFSSTEYGVLHGKPVYKKENGASAISSSMPSGPGIAGNNITRHPMPVSDSVTAESKPHSVSTADGVLSSSQPSPGYQPAWVGVPGQISMADVVRMGRPKASCTPIVSNEASFPPPTAVLTNVSQNTLKHPIACGSLSAESNHNLYSSLDTVSKVPETDHEPGIATSQHNSHDERPMVEQSQAANEVQVSEGDVTVENLGTDCAGSASGSNRHTLEDNSGGMSHFDNTSFQNMSSLHPHRHAFQAQEGKQWDSESYTRIGCCYSFLHPF